MGTEKHISSYSEVQIFVALITETCKSVLLVSAMKVKSPQDVITGLKQLITSLSQSQDILVFRKWWGTHIIEFKIGACGPVRV